MSRFAVLLALLFAGAQAFSPSHVSSRAMRRRGSSAGQLMASSKESAIVPVNEDNIKSTVAVAAAGVGFLVGGWVPALALAAVGNHVANKEGTVGETTLTAGKVGLNMYNLIIKVNDELGVSDKVSEALGEAFANAKDKSTGDALDKAEEAYYTITTKAGDLNDEYKLVEAIQEVLANAGEVSIQAIDAGLKFADENDVVGKAQAALVTAGDGLAEKAAKAKTSRD